LSRRASTVPIRNRRTTPTTGGPGRGVDGIWPSPNRSPPTGVIRGADALDLGCR
jgi:hypothetical protein